ncbi:uncharacterized protein TNCT_52441 [Trichonephila clavata]|uniref:Uncharacterized protein n=1 Tax=Trichonephila clavata TaxID=2740835 RepID=A0A8X6G751_TRICU|nr:uncharacterized protein TNCT_52441 [Trichonephila clavata]
MDIITRKSLISSGRYDRIQVYDFYPKTQGPEIKWSLERRPLCKHVSQRANMCRNNAILPDGSYFLQHRYLYIQQRNEWREMKKKFWFVPDLEFIYEEDPELSRCLCSSTNGTISSSLEKTRRCDIDDISWTLISDEEVKDSAEHYRSLSRNLGSGKDDIVPTISKSDIKNVRRDKKKKIKHKHLKKFKKKFRPFCK